MQLLSTTARCVGLLVCGLLLTSGTAGADELNSGDTAWMLTATALVLFMTIPGLSLFYAGMVRSKNVLSVFMQCFAITGLVTILWVVVGYSIAFGGEGPLWGGFGKMFLAGVGVETLSGTIPESVFMTFQMTFRDYHTGFNGRGVCRTHEVQRHAVVHGDLVDRCLRPGLPLGVG